MSTETTYPVKVIRNVMIPMPDGVRLAANLFIPEAEGCYPGIFEFVPYHKDGRVGLAHEAHNRHFASRGYAVMQVDFRGTGSSEGVNPYPMDPQEREDGYHIVEWMAAQPWCTGSVGIWGISYGGITSLSIASTRPPHLKAIIPIHATVDNHEWLFRTHGCRGLLLGDVDWGTRMVASNLLPPLLPDDEGQWFRLWRERLAANAPWFMEWHGQPRDPDFWLRRRIPYDQIDVPTFGICGWYDAYTAPTFMVYEAVRAPKRVLIGPWKHALPDVSPNVPIGGIHEMDRWWDRWLKGIENGVEDEPPVTIYVLGVEEWRHEAEWPIARTRPSKLYLQSSGGLSSDPAAGETGADEYTYDARVGLGSVGYNGHRTLLPIPLDQSADDHMSLCYTTPPLEADTDITGVPVAHVALSATAEKLTLVAKLCLVDADGRSRVISQGCANPARADAHAARVPLAAGEVREVVVRMHPTSMVARAGQRLRLCLAGADFPDLWPTPQPYTLRVQRGGQPASYVEVPIVPARATPLPAPPLQPARTDLGPVGVVKSRESHVVHRELATRTASFETRNQIENRINAQATLRNDHHAIVATDADRPWTTNLRTETTMELDRPLGTVSVRVKTLVTPFTIHVTAEVDVDGQPFFRESWTKDLDDWVAPTGAQATPARVATRG